LGGGVFLVFAKGAIVKWRSGEEKLDDLCTTV
jgi:hypothetical protein